MLTALLSAHVPEKLANAVPAKGCFMTIIATNVASGTYSKLTIHCDFARQTCILCIGALW